MTPSEARVLILGSKGQLGTELQASFAGSREILAYDRDEIDVTDSAAVRALISDFRPVVVLNASAYTAVDRAESEPDKATEINADAPGLLAEEVRRIGALFVHYSTDYVFDGTKRSAYLEDDAPNPLNVYGRTKLAGERAVQKAGGRYLIFRTSWVYGLHGNNFMRTILRLGQEKKDLRVVDDQVGAPTTSVVLARASRSAVDQLITKEWDYPHQWAGLYHMTCGGKTTWCRFAQAILTTTMGEDAPVVTGICSDEYVTAAKRPKNSVLSNGKLLSRFGISLPDWSLALNSVLTNYDTETITTRN